ncbi:MAG: hypothetical protein ACTSPY_07010 [Candidatus Helarchaeota archaeon]
MDIPAVISEQAILKILASAIRFANFALLKEDWGEVYGLLQGKIEDNKVIVTDAIAFTHTIKDESELFLKVGFGPEDYVAAAELSEKILPEFFVGWYHSHPGIDLFLSDFDNETQLGYQNQNPYAIALVVDPILIIKNNNLDQQNFISPNENLFGFKIFRLENIELGTESKFYEVKWSFNGDISKIKKEIDFLIDAIPKYLPAMNLEKRLIKFVEQNKKKVQNQFYSLFDYIDQFSKSEKKKRKEIFEKRYPELQNVINNLISTIKTRIYLLDFLEYKEYEIKERFTQEFKDLLNYICELNDKLEETKQDIL